MKVNIEVPSAVTRACGLQRQGTGRQEREEKVPRGLGEGAGTVPLSLSLGPALSRAHLNHDGWEAVGPVMPFPIPVPAHLPTCPSCPQISYQSIESSDPVVNVPGPRRTISKLRNETYHVFSNLHPGTTYLFSVRARTGKGFGQAALTEITTNISGQLRTWPGPFGETQNSGVSWAPRWGGGPPGGG